MRLVTRRSLHGGFNDIMGRKCCSYRAIQLKSATQQAIKPGTDAGTQSIKK